MKKIIAIFLLIALVMALAACKDDTGDNTGDNNTGDSVGDSTGNTGIAAKIDEMYARSAPTKTVTTIENSLAGVILTDKITLEGSAEQRKSCGCPANKSELLKIRPHQCENKCLYCYWR